MVLSRSVRELRSSSSAAKCESKGEAERQLHLSARLGLHALGDRLLDGPDQRHRTDTGCDRQVRHETGGKAMLARDGDGPPVEDHPTFGLRAVDNDPSQVDEGTYERVAGQLTERRRESPDANP
jgi:hypothetical protein